MNKVVYVEAHFSPIGKNVMKDVPTGETKKHFFGQKPVTEEKMIFQQEGISDSCIDGQRLSDDIAACISELNTNGYEVIAVTPITSGNHRHHWDGANGAYGYGFSYTTGVNIVGKKFVR